MIKTIRRLYIPLLISLTFSSNVFSQNIESIQAGFGGTVKDEQILDLLNSNKLKPKAVFMWSSGISVTHRTYEDTDNEKVLKDARKNLMDMFESGIQSNAMRSKRFTENYSEEDIENNEDLELQARSLINIREQLSEGLKHAKLNNPLIFGVEVKGAESDIERFRHNGLVKNYHNINNQLPSEKRSIKPKAFKKEFLNHKAYSASKNGLRSQLLEISKSVKED